MLSTMPYSYSKKMVAFVDILGFRNKTDKGNDGKQSVHDTLTIIRKLVEAYKQTNFFDCIPKHKDKIKYYVFSDSMLFSSTPDTFYTIVSAIAYLQFVCATKGFFLRGGISYGEIFDKNSFFYGNGLNQSYELESKTACYPRVIVSPALTAKIINTENNQIPLSEDNQEYLYLRNTQFSKDFDGCYYINFLSPEAKNAANIDVNIPGISYSIDNYCDIEQNIDKEYREAREKHNSNLLIKYDWLKKYYTNFKEKNPSLF